MRSLRALTVLLLLLMAAFTAPVSAADPAAAKPVLIDVRTDAEWQVEHLEGAILVSHEKIAAEIAKIAPDRKTRINLYCRSGRRSGIALDILKNMGYEDVTNYGSVKDAAEKLNIPVVRGAQ